MALTRFAARAAKVADTADYTEVVSSIHGWRHKAAHTGGAKAPSIAPI